VAFTPGSIIDDAPFEIHESQTGFEVWDPQNYDQEFAGPITLRYALAKSKNLVAIRILQAITPEYARNYLARFGFNPKHHPPYLTMALGAGSTTPLEMARGYAVFANGGYLVEPYFISHIEDIEGNLIFKTKLQRKRTTADQVLDTRNVFTMNSLLQNVIQNGTGIRAKSLGRKDLAGKTGQPTTILMPGSPASKDALWLLLGLVRISLGHWATKKLDQKQLCLSGLTI
jgi:penicillin-binding protein 1A